VAASGQEKADYAERAEVPAQAPADSPGTDKPERHAVLVGYGVKASSTTRRARKTAPHTTAELATAELATAELATEPRATEPRATEPRATEPRAAEPRAAA